MARQPLFEDLEQFVGELQSRLDPAYRRLDDDVLDWRQSAGESTLDLVEYDDEFVVTVDLPGYGASDVDVRLEERQLTVDVGPRTESTSDEERGRDGRSLRQQRLTVPTVQTVTFPQDVRTDAAVASMDHGVLTVTVPKRRPDTHGTNIEIE